MALPENKTFVPRPKESDEVIQARWKKKREHIHQLANDVRRLRLNVSNDLKNNDDEKTFLTALVIGTMLFTAERVGNSKSESNGHVGVTGLKKSDVSIDGNKVTLNYIGKSGVEHNKSFSDERIAKHLKWAIKNSPSEFVFTESNGTRIRAKRVNIYLEKFSVTAKDLRGYLANKFTLDKLKSIEPDETEKKRKKQLNKILKQVAERVGHGRPTLKKHYLIPELSIEFEQRGKIIDIMDLGYFEKGGDTSSAEPVQESVKAYVSFREYYVHSGALIFGGY